jgi:hypothetical protein
VTDIRTISRGSEEYVVREVGGLYMYVPVLDIRLSYIAVMLHVSLQVADRHVGPHKTHKIEY